MGCVSTAVPLRSRVTVVVVGSSRSTVTAKVGLVLLVRLSVPAPGTIGPPAPGPKICCVKVSLALVRSISAAGLGAVVSRVKEKVWMLPWLPARSVACTPMTFIPSVVNIPGLTGTRKSPLGPVQLAATSVAGFDGS